ncbi:MAG: lasso peptide isopeptide bond-forming cyclase [Thermodesulfobacteriota bacterium]
MSGICGYFARQPADLGPGRLAEMLAAISHRGPDGHGTWQDGRAGLGQQLLWTTPESKFAQLPLVDEATGLVLCADARIDNRAELADLLDLRLSAKQKKIPDSRFILASFKKWGEGCPARLIGDYAFVIWDKRRQQLFCARDHLGARPFYYFLSEQIFAFASEIKGLLALPQIEPRLNEPRVADFLQRIVDNNRDTFHRDIWRLEPATSLTVGLERLAEKRYWQLDPQRKLPQASSEEYAQQFREIFTEAVRCRLRSAYPIGCTLSGGLDSSAVACVARDILAARGEKLHTFSATFPDLPPAELAKSDERGYQQAVIKQGGFIPHPFRADQLCPLEGLERQLEMLDEPFFAPNGYLLVEANRLARESGVRVMLDGLDGDTVVSHGYERLHGLAISGRWPTLVEEILLIAERQGESKKKLLYNLGIRPYLREPLAHLYRLWRSAFRPAWNYRKIVNPNFGRRWGLSERLKPELDSFRRPAAIHKEYMASTLQTSALEMANSFATASGVSNRSPFYDRRLLEFCLALPAEEKLQQGWPRYILRKAMKGIVPESVLWRPDKGDLGYGFDYNLHRCHGDLIQWVAQEPHPLLEMATNMELLQRDCHNFCHDPASRQKNSLNIYSALLLQTWLGATEGIISSVKQEDGLQ